MKPGMVLWISLGFREGGIGGGLAVCRDGAGFSGDAGRIGPAAGAGRAGRCRVFSDILPMSADLSTGRQKAVYRAQIRAFDSLRPINSHGIP